MRERHRAKKFLNLYLQRNSTSDTIASRPFDLRIIWVQFDTIYRYTVSANSRHNGQNETVNEKQKQITSI